MAATSDNKVVITRIENKPSTNNYTIFNGNIKRVTTHFVHNKKSNITSS
jgi:hypothetical protein